MTLDEQLADLVLAGRTSGRFRSAFGVVTALSGLDSVYVRFDSMESGSAGPIYVITGKLAVNDRALVTYLPDNRVWVAWGKPVGGADLTLSWLVQVASDIAPLSDVQYMHRRAGAWDAEVYTKAETTGTLAMGAKSQDLTDLNEHLSPFGVEPSVVTDMDSAEDHTRVFAVNTSPHIFRMSDGGLVVISGSGPSLFQGVFVRSPSTGVWTNEGLLPLASYSSGGGETIWCRNGDTLYGHGNGLFFRITYTAGAITVSNAESRIAEDPDTDGGGLGIYYDATNALVHVWRDKRLIDDLSAVSPSTLAVQYNSVDIRVDFGSGTDATALVGDGGGTFIAFTYRSQYRVYNVVAGASSYVVGAREDLPALASTAIYGAAIWDGSAHTIVGGRISGGNTLLYVTRRTAPNTYDAWALLTTVVGDPITAVGAFVGDLNLIRHLNPEAPVLRVLYTARARYGGGGADYQVREDLVPIS